MFNGISTFVDYLSAKAILEEEQSEYYSTHSCGDKGVHAVAQLEFEPANSDVAVQYASHDTTETSPQKRVMIQNYSNIITKAMKNCLEIFKQMETVTCEP